MPWSTGTSSAGQRVGAPLHPVLGVLGVGRAASAAPLPPLASTVVTRQSTRPRTRSSASTRPSSSGRSEYDHTHSALAPAASIAATSASIHARFPDTRWVR